MQENLGRNICDSIESTRQLLQEVGPTKTRKIVLNVEKNLHNFIRYPFLERLKGIKGDHIRLASDAYINFRALDKKDSNKNRNHSIFNLKLLDRELQKLEQSKNGKQEQGILCRNLM